MRIKNVIPQLMRIIFLIRIIQLFPKRKIFSYLPRIEIVAYNFSKSKKQIFVVKVAKFMVLWIGEKKGGYLLKFQQKGLKEVHLLTEQINFPVAIAVYNDWEKTQVQYLLANIKSTRFTSYSICRWCIVHKIQYQILYPIRKISILKNPYKYYQYIKLLMKLNKFSLQNS